MNTCKNSYDLVWDYLYDLLDADEVEGEVHGMLMALTPVGS